MMGDLFDLVYWRWRSLVDKNGYLEVVVRLAESEGFATTQPTPTGVLG